MHPQFLYKHLGVKMQSYMYMYATVCICLCFLGNESHEANTFGDD